MSGHVARGRDNSIWKLLFIVAGIAAFMASFAAGCGDDDDDDEDDDSTYDDDAGDDDASDDDSADDDTGDDDSDDDDSDDDADDDDSDDDVDDDSDDDADDDADDDTGGNIVDVTIESFDVSPDPININVGDTVRWTNEDGVNHTVTSGSPGSPDGEFDETVPKNGGTAEVTFNSAGTRTYYCKPHSGMMNGYEINVN